jgi:hypothetical protein
MELIMMFILSKKKLNKLFFLFLVILAMSSNQVFAADKNCVKCDPSKVAGSPDASLGGLDKVVVAMASSSTTKYKTADLSKMGDYCGLFEVGSNDGTITPLIAKIETEGFSHVEVFSANVCPPKKLDPSKYLTPMIQYVADDSENRYNFPNEIYKYLEKTGNKDGWLKIINAKNSKGMTYLDYVKYVYKKTKNEDLKPRLLKLYQYACDHGGEFSFYNTQTCSSSIDL